MGNLNWCPSFSLFTTSLFSLLSHLYLRFRESWRGGQCGAVGTSRWRHHHPLHGLQQRPVVGREGWSLLPLLQSDNECCRGLCAYPAQGHESHQGLWPSYRTDEIKKVSQCATPYFLPLLLHMCSQVLAWVQPECGFASVYLKASWNQYCLHCVVISLLCHISGMFPLSYHCRTPKPSSAKASGGDDLWSSFQAGIFHLHSGDEIFVTLDNIQKMRPGTTENLMGAFMISP